MNEISEIFPGVWQGADPAGHLPMNITAVLNLSPSIPPVKHHLYVRSVLWLPIEDGPFPGIDWLEHAIDYIESCRLSKLEVLVHCALGVSRSSLVTIGYTMKQNKLSFPQAYEYVKSKRAGVRPNLEFAVGLRQYEERLNGGTSV